MAQELTVKQSDAVSSDQGAANGTTENSTN